MNNAVANRYSNVVFYGERRFGVMVSDGGYQKAIDEVVKERKRLMEELEKIQEIYNGYSNNVYPHLSDAEMTLRSTEVYMTEAISKLEEHYNGTDTAVKEKGMLESHNGEIGTMLSKAESFKTNVSNRMKELEQIESEINSQIEELEKISIYYKIDGVTLGGKVFI